MDFGRISHPCCSEINSISEPLKSLEQKAQNMPYVGDAEMTSDGRSSFLGTEAVGSLSAFSFLISALPADTEGRKRKFENSGLNHIPLSSVLPTVVNYRKIISVWLSKQGHSRGICAKMPPSVQTCMQCMHIQRRIRTRERPSHRIHHGNTKSHITQISFPALLPTWIAFLYICMCVSTLDPLGIKILGGQDPPIYFAVLTSLPAWGWWVERRKSQRKEGGLLEKTKSLSPL